MCGSVSSHVTCTPHLHGPELYGVTHQRVFPVSITAGNPLTNREAMEPLWLPPHDEEDDFQKSLLDLLGSPTTRHHNGASNLFNIDYSSTCGYGESRRCQRCVHWSKLGLQSQHGMHSTSRLTCASSSLDTVLSGVPNYTYCAFLVLLTRRACIPGLLGQSRLHKAEQLVGCWAA